jgi:hypothetical protein
MASAIVMEDVILKLVNELNSSFWSIDSLGAEVQYFAKKNLLKQTICFSRFMRFCLSPVQLCFLFLEITASGVFVNSLSTTTWEFCQKS